MTERDGCTDRHDAVAALEQALESDLLGRYGPLISSDDLRQALGYPTMDAFRQALSRRHLPVPVFSVAHRRGKFALSKDVARWLASLRGNMSSEPQNKQLALGPVAESPNNGTSTSEEEHSQLTPATHSEGGDTQT